MFKLTENIKSFFVSQPKVQSNTFSEIKNFANTNTINLAEVIQETFRVNNFDSIVFNKGNYSFYLSCYKDLVASCIDARAMNVAISKPVLFEMLNQTEKKEVINEHPIISIIQNPSKRYSWYDLIKKTIMLQDLTGNCYWLIRRNKFNYPIGFSILSPEYVRIKINKYTTDTEEYALYSPSNELIDSFSPDDIIHFSYDNPKCESPYGIGLIEKAAYIIDVYNFQSKYQKKLFENDGRIASLLQLTADFSAEEKEKMLETWNKNFSGTQNAGKTAILPPDVQYKQIQNSPKELDYAQSSVLIREIMLMIFQTPNGILGNSKDLNRANARPILENFTKSVVSPLLRSIDEKLNRFIIENFGEKLRLEHQPDLKPDIDELQKMYDMGAITSEQVATAMGYK